MATNILASSSSLFFSGSSEFQVNRGAARVICRKADIHPEFHEEAKVYCKGDLVMTTGGTQAEYIVDIWSGNHPFFQDDKSAIVLNADQVEKFRQKYGSLGAMNKVPILTGVLKVDKKKLNPVKPKTKGKGKSRR